MNRKTAVSVLFVFASLAARASEMPPIAAERDGARLVEISVTGYGAILVEYEDATGDRSGMVLARSDDQHFYHRLGGNLLGPSGERYFFLETPDRKVLWTDNFMYPPNYDIDDDLRPDQPVPPFGDRIIFHVCLHDLSGKQIKTIPIEEPYAAAYNSATWLSERWISITKLVRDRPSYTLLIDLEAGRKHVSGVDTPMTTADGNDVFFCHRGVVYYNFTSVYPIEGEPLLDIGSRESWERYRQRYIVQGEPTLKSRLAKMSSYVTECVLMPDGRHIAALDMRTFAASLAEGGQPTLEGVPADAPAPILVFLETEALKRGEPTGDFIRTMELPKDASLEFDLENEGLIVDRETGEIVIGKSMPSEASGP
jgi:hypothetical protein